MIFVLTISCKEERPTGMVPSLYQVLSWRIYETVFGVRKVVRGEQPMHGSTRGLMEAHGGR
jgi:hypothetical protein